MRNVICLSVIIVILISSCGSNRAVFGTYMSECRSLGGPEYIIEMHSDSTYSAVYGSVGGIIFYGVWEQRGDTIIAVEKYSRYFNSDSGVYYDIVETDSTSLMYGIERKFLVGLNKIVFLRKHGNCTAKKIKWLNSVADWWSK